MNRAALSYLLALLSVGLIAAVTDTLLPVLGLASAALLFLLPVLFVAARGGVGPGLFAALAGATCYNYFLLPPRHTFNIHGPDNLISAVVLVAVALVTSRLASRLQEREAEAQARAASSLDLADLSSIVAGSDPDRAVAEALDWLDKRFGAAAVIVGGAMPDGDAGFSALDLSAAAWAMHNADITGHGSAVMAASEWTFLPLSRRRHHPSDVAAVARPMDGTTRSETELGHMGQLARLLGQGRDRLALDREQRLREKVEDSDRLRKTLIASLAHDFRTPLTVITGQLEALAAQTPQVGEAVTAAHRLHRTMEDLIAAAQIEEGSLAPRTESLDLVDSVQAACAAMARTSPKPIRHNVPSNLPLVRGDPVLLHHVILNLLDNAARHAETVTTVGALSKDDRVQLWIANDGPAIPASDTSLIFERFTRMEGSDRHDGSGLGLAIVKGFCDAMDVTVSVSSREGETRFTLGFIDPATDRR